MVALSTLLGISLVTFAILHLSPGEPEPGDSLDFRPTDEITLAALRARYGLDRPLAVQYADWVKRLVQLDFGRSFVDHRLVREKILERLPRTVLLNAVAFLLIGVLAIPIGAGAAAHPGSPADRAAAPLLYLLYSLPSFWLALLLQGTVAVGLGAFPLAGLQSEGAEHWSLVRRWGDAAWHLVLPAICLSAGSLAFFARFTRANLLEALGSDFIRAARSRGLPDRRLLWGHALAVSRIPFLTLAGLVLPTLLSGSVVIERIFAWPGLGSLFFESLFARDYPTILGLAVLSALLVLAGTLGVDLLYLVADPRLRRPGETR